MKSLQISKTADIAFVLLKLIGAGLQLAQVFFEWQIRVALVRSEAGVRIQPMLPRPDPPPFQANIPPPTTISVPPFKPICSKSRSATDEH